MAGPFFHLHSGEWSNNHHSGAKLSRCARSTTRLQSLILVAFAIKGMLPVVVESVEVKIR